MKKRIALMVNSLHFGGAERVFADLSVYLHEQGHEVHLFLMDDTDIAYPYGGKVHKIALYAKAGSRLATLLLPQYFIMGWYYKRKLRIDYTISAMEFLNLINLMIPGKDKKIVTMHNHKWQCEVTPTFKDNLIERMFSRRMGKIHAMVAVSEGIRQKAIGLYDIAPEKVVTIYNASRTEDIAKQAKEPIAPETQAFMTPDTFLNASRLEDQKSIHKLILAFSIVAKSNDGARLVLAGDGSLRQKLQELARSLGLGDKILFTGFVKNPFALMAQARAFVLSSCYEGFGNVLVEAMCCSCPVISTDCLCGPREIIAPGTTGTADKMTACEYGILVPPPRESGWDLTIDDCVMEMARAMQMVMADKDQLYRAKSLQRAQDFTLNRLYPKWETIL